MNKKIAFILPNLLTGGTQRAMINIATSLSKYNFDIVFLVVNKLSKSYSNNPTIEKKNVSNFDSSLVRTVFLECDGVKWSIFKIREVLKKERPDVLFSSLSYFNLYISFLKFLLPKDILLIGRETNILSVKHLGLKYRSLLNYLYKRAYSKFDFMVCQSEDMQIDLIEHYGISKEKTIVINNPVDSNSVIERSKERLPEIKDEFYNIISVGHLTRQKGHELLLNALSLINDSNIKLHIIGRGVLLESLKSKCVELDITEQVEFLGFRANPFKYISKCDLFVFPSQFEGFPNALIEAGIIGIPLVANNCKGGINEIINSENGFISEYNSAIDMAKKIQLCRQKQFNKIIIRNDFVLRYDIDVIGKKYAELFQSFFS